MENYNMRYRICCHERWPTIINIRRTLHAYLCPQCNNGKGDPKLYSFEKDMHTDALIESLIPKLLYFRDAIHLECMLVSLACPIMCLVWHKSVIFIYESHGINFLQDFEGGF